jgi:phosphoribosylanthranilate isomerase
MPPTLVKLCGFLDPAEARHALDLGVHWIGLNFHPPSKRYLRPDLAPAFLESFPERSPFVALFVDRPVPEILQLTTALGLTTVQLHGQETPSEVRALRSAGLHVIKAFRVGGTDDLDRMSSRLAEALPDSILLDAFVPGEPGGTGRLIAADLLASLPPLPSPLILAGGLDPDTVAPAIRLARPWMVDAASGVESSPGRKCPRSVEAFLRSVRAADPSS